MQVEGRAEEIDRFPAAVGAVPPLSAVTAVAVSTVDPSGWVPDRPELYGGGSRDGHAG